MASMADLADTALILIVLLLPGAFAAWGYERYRELYARRSKDWLIRLAAISGMSLTITAGPLYWLVSNYGDDFRNQNSLPWWMVGIPLAYIGVPTLLGIASGLASRWITARYERKVTKISQVLASTRDAPTAWDYVFHERRSGMIRCKLKNSDRWVGGLFGPGGFLGSYAAGHGSEREIYVSQAIHFDAENGQPGRTTENDWDWVGGTDGAGIIIKWDDIETIEFMPIGE